MSLRVMTVLGLLLTLAAGCAGGPVGPAGTTRAGEAVEARSLGSGPFPDGFLWGVATAGYQYEGGDTTSNWAVWERGKRTKHPIGKAIDHWNRYEEDLDHAKSLGLNAFRFSLEWARIEPDRGRFDQAAIAHYHAVLAACRARGLEPVVTILHFAHPAWLDGLAGPGKSAWEDDRTIGEFKRFAGWAASEYGAEVKWWITINEPNTVGTMGFLNGVFPPGKRNPFAFNAAMDRQVRAHLAAYPVVKKADPDSMVSLCPPVMGLRWEDPEYPPGTTEAQKEAIRLYFDETTVLDRLQPRKGQKGKRTLDYMAFNYYYLARPTDFLIKQFDRWPVYPEGLYQETKRLYARYGLPVMITENGMATVGDAPRPDAWSREAFLVNHLAQLRKAGSEGVPLLGYMHWSLVDNYEWGSYDPRFGLYAIDRRDPGLRRIKTGGAEVYEQIAKANQIPLPLLDRYLGKRN